MTGIEHNPYESPKAGEPPIRRLGWVAYVLLSLAVVLIGIVAFCICLATLCFAGVFVGMAGDADGPRVFRYLGNALTLSMVPVSFVVMLIVVRRLSKAWIRRGETQ